MSKAIKVRDLETVSASELPEQHNLPDSSIMVFKDLDTGRFYIQKKVARNNIKTLVDKYELVKVDGTIEVLPLDQDRCVQILNRLSAAELSFNACFVFHEDESDLPDALDWEKTEEEHAYTSTGIKFWRHHQQMEEFLWPQDGFPRNTVVSTHVSAEGMCNLRCPYCSVTYRDNHSRIPFDVVKKYVEDLMTRGLRAVILTGGGEPTLYPHFNELVQWIKYEKGLSVALITNGTTRQRIDPETLGCFSWIRVSINVFAGWEDKIGIDTEHLSPECVVGCSLVYTSEHQAGEEFEGDRPALLKKVSKVADNCGAQYIRVLPNCLLEQKQLIQQHIALQKVLDVFPDKRFFQQYKVHGTPNTSTCHQSYFRPYLSEEPSIIDGTPGTVFPCDSVVLNDSVTHFAEKYQLCKPGDILDYIDGNIAPNFDPREDCKGCVFTETVNMLDDYKSEGTNRFADFPDPLKHEEFV
ncbi:hypothetical protein LCGC14_0747520 [marine sediment metagenome]|uniref:Radical SAM core domain-containing protein n=1 Tax=marine sediment metagenome TaxID=412755 RepID=A0A0F9TBZ4_9ZZZZ